MDESKEDPFELGNELMKLYRKANPKEDPETEHAQRELIDTFCEALPSSIRIHVERAKPRNFDEAKNLALEEYHLKKRVFPENKNQKTPNANQNADKNRSPLLRNVSDFQPLRNFPAREQNMPSPRLPIFNPAPSVAVAAQSPSPAPQPVKFPPTLQNAISHAATQAIQQKPSGYLPPKPNPTCDFCKQDDGHTRDTCERYKRKLERDARNEAAGITQRFNRRLALIGHSDGSLNAEVVLEQVLKQLEEQHLSATEASAEAEASYEFGSEDEGEGDILALERPEPQDPSNPDS